MVDVQALLRIANENVEQILSSLNLDYIKEGGYIATKCVFHGGDDYNLKFKGDFFYCFSKCQRKFSIINVVQKVLDLEFLDAVKWLCDELNIREDTLTIDKQKVELREKVNRLKLMKQKKRKVEYKPIGQDVLNLIEPYIHPYMLDQGFKKETLEHFGLGYSRYGFFANRITIPIDSPNGDIIAFSGRLPNAKELGLPKYKLSAHVDVSTTLYNISRIDKSKGYSVITEGFKSCWSLYEWGITNCVALMGANLSKIQRNILLAQECKLIIIGDNDDAGKRLNQIVYNQCSKYTNVYKIDMKDFSNNEKDSPCETDIGFDNMCELVDKIEELI